MKCLLINLIFFVNVVKSDTHKPLFLPQLPAGEYRMNIIGSMRCVSIKSNNKINYNWYISKKSANTTEIKGNLTMLIPFDDSLDLEINMAIKDSIGGWKENAFSFKTPKACSSLKMILGNAWTPILHESGVHNTTCPIHVGVYKSSGIDTALFGATNFPKTFFYGTYRVRFFFTKNKEIFGCFIIVMEIKRPWETI